MPIKIKLEAPNPAPTPSPRRAKRNNLLPHLLPAAAVIIILFTLVLSSCAPPARPTVSRAQTAGPLILPATWTPPPEPTQRPSRTPANTPTMDVTLTAASQTLRMMMLDVVDTWEGPRYTLQSIPSLDMVAAARPDDADANFQLGKAYVQIAGDTDKEEEYIDDLSRGLKALDKAIRLDPAQGEYFQYRGYLYRDQARIADYSADRERLLEIALDNFHIAARLTHYGIDAQTSILARMGELGRCQEALDLEQQWESAGAYSPDAVVEFNFHMAQLYLCTGKYTQALDNIDQYIQMYGVDCSSSKLRTIILYNAGRKPEALDEITACLDRWALGQGDRYYWRALLYYDGGQTDLIAEDLKHGAANTWNHEGLYTYLQARLALDAGDRAHGIELLQEAEATMDVFSDGPVVLARVRKDLAALGAPRLAPTPDESQFPSTPMPAGWPDAPTATP